MKCILSCLLLVLFGCGGPAPVQHYNSWDMLYCSEESGSIILDFNVEGWLRGSTIETCYVCPYDSPLLVPAVRGTQTFTLETVYGNVLVCAIYKE